MHDDKAGLRDAGERREYRAEAGMGRGLFAIDADAEALGEQQHAGDDRERPRDPAGHGEAKQDIQPEDQEEDGEEDMAHGG